MNTTGKNWALYLGIITEPTVTWNQRSFHIYIPELSPLHEGDVTPEYITIPVNIKNLATGSTENKSVKLTKTVKADYFGVESSRSVPTMAKGQQVLVLNFGNTDKYYWLPLERDDYLKTFERYRLSCANIAVTNKTDASCPTDIKAKKDGLTDDNTYFFEMDTRDRKIIRLSTSNSDGEPWRYYFHIDPDEKSITLWDEHVDENATDKQPPNTIKLESRPSEDIKGRITLQNASGTTIKLEDKNMFIIVPDNLFIDVGGEILTNVEKNASTRIGGDNSLTIEGNNAVNILGNQGVNIGNDDKLLVGNDKLIEVGNDYTVHTVNNFIETQRFRKSKTDIDVLWETLTWTMNAETSITTKTITENINTANTTIITTNFTHVSEVANIKYAECKNVIVKNPESEGAIPMSKIV